MPAVEVECLRIKVLVGLNHVHIVVDLLNLLAELLRFYANIMAYLYVEVSIMSQQSLQLFRQPPRAGMLRG